MLNPYRRQPYYDTFEAVASDLEQRFGFADGLGAVQTFGVQRVQEGMAYLEAMHSAGAVIRNPAGMLTWRIQNR